MKHLFVNMPGRQKIKDLILRIPGGAAGLKAIANIRRQRYFQGLGDPADVFTHYYHSNWWGDGESRSGAGSTLKYTENIRKELPSLIDSLGVKRMLDAPCGDFNWFQHVELKGDVHYTGGDIVAPLVAKNNELFGNDRRKFVVLDVTKDPLQEVDLWMCRDCLFHLPLADIQRVLNRFRNGNIRYLLTSMHPECENNREIFTGEFRLLNLTKPPFNLCPPQLVIDDWIEGYPVRYLALWERSMLK
jgi:SAM-dependent methyltransferase